MVVGTMETWLHAVYTHAIVLIDFVRFYQKGLEPTSKYCK